MKEFLLPVCLALAACGAPAGGNEGTAGDVASEPLAETLAPEVTPNEPVDAAQLAAGRYCYLLESETSTEGLEIDVSASGVYSGRHYGTVHDEASSYFTAFETTLSHGEAMEDMRVGFQTLTKVDGDTQTGDDTWVIRMDEAHLGAFPDAVMVAVACDMVAATVWPPIEE